VGKGPETVGNELGRLFDSSPDAFCIAGFDGNVKMANPAFARMLGYTQQELLTRRFVDILHPDDVESVRALVVELEAGNDIVEFECRHVCADGSVRWFEWNSRTAPEEGVVYGVGRDVTERRVVNAEFLALHRVAILVAHGVRPDEIFAAASAEVGRLFSGTAAVAKFEHHPPAIVVAAVQQSAEQRPIGSRWELSDGLASTEVYRTGRSARVDESDSTRAAGLLSPDARPAHSGSTVVSPIIVEGRLWGTIIVSTEVRPPNDAEERLEKFTELIATTISNAESREALAQLADEQAALRRMGMLVARGVPASEIFAAVCDEVERLFGAQQVAVGKFDADGLAIVAAGVGKSIEEIVPVGTRWDLDDTLASTQVFRTGLVARVESRDWSSLSGPIAASLRRMGLVSTVASPIVVEDRLWGAMTVSSRDAPLPPDTEERLANFTDLVATAIANANSRAELAASRRRIVAASDEARRRIERDLHDGTQQRLVSLGLLARAAEAMIARDRDDLRAQLSSIATGLADAVADLQEISRGIHPAILTKGGIRPALQTLARRSTIPVELDLTLDERLAEPIEVAVYFVASEALANAAKHAQASRLEISLGTRNGRLMLAVRDDGVGGADAARGSGLVGLTDRVEALGGVIHIRSQPGEGTRIAAELPFELPIAADPELTARRVNT
jgi:PAS domain S-box-containing protein